MHKHGYRLLLTKLVAGFLASLSAVALMSLPGCSGSSADQSTPKAGQSVTLAQQLKAIDDNTHMPPEAKAAAKAALQGHQGMDLSRGRK